MSVRVEFYGIPRRRAGVAAVEIDARTLGEAVSHLRRALPQLAEICDADGRLHVGYLANVNGRTFTGDPAHPLRDGDAVLILSADAGG